MVTVYTHSFAIDILPPPKPNGYRRGTLPSNFIDESVANEGTFAFWTILLLCCMIKVQQLGQYKNR